jgi:hypothetical protein
LYVIVIWKVPIYDFFKPPFFCLVFGCTPRINPKFTPIRGAVELDSWVVFGKYLLELVLSHGLELL